MSVFSRFRGCSSRKPFLLRSYHLVQWFNSLAAKNKTRFLVMNTETAFETKFYLIKINNFNNFLTVMNSSKWIYEIQSFQTSEVPKFTYISKVPKL